MQLGYIGIEVSDPGAFGQYLAGVLGLRHGHARPPQASTWRMDDKAHRVIVEHGPANDAAYAGFVVADRTEFDAAVAQLSRGGFRPLPGSAEEVTARGVDDLVYVQAPWGVRVEIARGLADAEEPFDSPLQPGGFLTGDLGMGHVVFYVPGGRAEFVCADSFVVKGLGLKLSDYLEIDMGGLSVSGNFYHCNERHHSLALIFMPVPEFPKKLDHIMIETVSMDNVGHAYDRALDANCPIMRDLGKHPNDKMFSFYSAGPGGLQFELGTGAVTVTDDWEVGKYDRVSAWGHHARADTSI
jgi:2,3-dihydroxybiphenyl 1,2-dioxygenase